MAAKRTGLRAILNHVERGRGHSTLFYYMLEHHDRLIRAWAGRAHRWVDLAAEFGAQGLTDRSGKPASAQIARQTWLRARRAVERARLQQLTGHPTGRSDRVAVPWSANGPASPGGRAVSAAPRPVGGPPVSFSPTSQPSGVDRAASHSGGPVSDEVVRARIERVRHVLEKRSGRHPINRLDELLPWNWRRETDRLAA